MNTTVFALLGAGIAFAVIAVFLKEQKKEFGVLISLASGLFIVIISIQYIRPLFLFISRISEYINFPSEWMVILIKILGITFSAQFACDVCRDCGENALAAKLETAGKLFILIFSLPLFEQLVKIIVDIL